MSDTFTAEPVKLTLKVYQVGRSIAILHTSGLNNAVWLRVMQDRPSYRILRDIGETLNMKICGKLRTGQCLITRIDKKTWQAHNGHYTVTFTKKELKKILIELAKISLEE